MQQWRDYAQDYKDRAGLPVAENFILNVEDALHFISATPKACPSYFPGEGCADLEKHHFRKWNLKDFPYVVLFRVAGNDIFVEAMYAHKQQVGRHLKIWLE